MGGVTVVCAKVFVSFFFRYCAQKPIRVLCTLALGGGVLSASSGNSKNEEEYEKERKGEEEMKGKRDIKTNQRGLLKPLCGRRVRKSLTKKRYAI